MSFSHSPVIPLFAHRVSPSFVSLHTDTEPLWLLKDRAASLSSAATRRWIPVFAFHLLVWSYLVEKRRIFPSSVFLPLFVRIGCVDITVPHRMLIMFGLTKVQSFLAPLCIHIGMKSVNKIIEDYFFWLANEIICTSVWVSFLSLCLKLH